jgi:DNA invertase Pin-like site-specific DNA recombinase
MMSVARRRYFDVVLFWALEAFPRKGALSTLQHLNRLSSYGIAFRSLTEPCLDSCGKFRETAVGILGTLANQERIRRSDSTRAALARAKQLGRKVGRPRALFARDQIPLLRRAGMSWSQISIRLGVSIASARRACQKLPD